MIDMSLFNDYFKSQIEYRNDFGMVMRFNNARVNKRILNFVFVEGSTDKRFYINTNIPKLSNNVEYFYKILSDQNDDYIGKEAVFYSYKVIMNDEKLKEDFDKCMFIVDRDYSEELHSHNLPMEQEDYAQFHITKGHSFEDYFVDGTNIEEIFAYYHLGDEEVLNFKNHFIDFFNNTYEYFALCGAIAEVFNSIDIKYRVKYRQSEIIKLDFENNDLFDKEKLNEENRRMRS